MVDWPIIAGIWKVESNHATDRRPHRRLPTGTSPRRCTGSPSTARTPAPPSSPTPTMASSTATRSGTGPSGPHSSSPARGVPSDRTATTTARPIRRTCSTPHSAPSPTSVSPPPATTPTRPTSPPRLLRYNNSAEYVATVTGWIDYYRAFQFTQGAVTADGLYAFPLPVEHGHRRPDPPQPPRLPRLRPRRPRRHPRLRRPPRHRHQRLRRRVPHLQVPCGWGVTITGARQPPLHLLPRHPSHRPTRSRGDRRTADHDLGQHRQLRGPSPPLPDPQPRRCPRSAPNTLLEAWWNGIGLSPVTAPTTGCTH